MSQTSEEIEAKLAAYIDGTLDDAGRAEIVKHLANNPTHARLLEDLAQGRQLLSALPREPAPPEIYEAIQAQLERRMLLDETAQQSAAAEARGSVWARRMAIAAVLMLSGTLALVVYSILPSPGHRSRELTELDRAAAGDAAVARSDPARPDPARPDPARPDAVGPIAVVSHPTVDPTPPAGVAVAGGETPVAPPVDLPAATGAGGRPTGDAFVTATASPAEVLLFLTDDRAAAESDIRAVLVQNRLDFEPIADPVAVAGAILTGESPLAAGRALRPTTEPSHDRAFGGVFRSVENGPTTAPGTPAADQPARQAKFSNEAVYFVRNVPRSQVQAINEALQQQQVRRGVSNVRAQQQQALPAKEQVLYNQIAQNFSKSKGEQGVGDPDRYGAKSAANEMPEPTESKRLTERAAPQSQAGGVVSESVGLIATGEKLRIRIDPSDGFGGGEQRVTVNEEGAVELPGSPPVQALGLTPSELEQRLASELRDKAMPNPQVRVRRDEASTLDAAPAAAAPTTGPIAGASGIDVTDLVIVVRQESDLPAAAPAEPSSQPSALPPVAPVTQPASQPAN